jgi:hypothetical protein
MWYSKLEKKTCISRHILHQHWYTCPVALPVRRNPQHRSLLTVVSANSAPPFQPLRHQRNVCHQATVILWPKSVQRLNYELDDGNRVSVPPRAKEIFSLSRRNWLWVPPSLPSSGYRRPLPRGKAEHSPPFSAEIEGICAPVPPPSHIFIAWCLIMQRDNFNFYILWVQFCYACSWIGPLISISS